MDGAGSFHPRLIWPGERVVSEGGISQRDWLAGMILASLTAEIARIAADDRVPVVDGLLSHTRELAICSYRMADEALKVGRGE